MSSAPRRLFRLCRTAFVASAAMLLSAGMALAGSWSATEVRGTVLSLTGDKWEDVASGQVFPGNVVIRTLGTGRITLAGGGVGVGLGGNAAVQIVEQGRSYALRQYAGALVVAADAAHPVTIEVPNGRVSFSAGQIQISISGSVTRIEVREGTARFVDARGVDTVVAAGQSARVADAGVSLRDQNGRPVETAQSSQGVVGSNPNAGAGNNSAGGNGNANAGAGNSDAGGNGNANAGAGNNNAGGNGGGSSTSSASGNPNAGAGNNNAGGHGNGGDNPNAGSGNNSGNGNGGDNPNAGAGNNSGNGGDNGNGGGGNENSGSGNNSSGGNGNGNGGEGNNGNGGGNGNGNGN